MMNSLFSDPFGMLGGGGSLAITGPGHGSPMTAISSMNSMNPMNSMNAMNSMMPFMPQMPALNRMFTGQYLQFYTVYAQKM